MRLTCWEEFNVPFMSGENTALVGVDLGAGNCSCALVDETKSSKVKPLYFDADATTLNLYTAFSYNDSKIFLGNAASSGDKTVSGPYTNFKRPPGDSAKEHYNGNLTNPTYEELMRRFFQGIVQRIFDSNVALSEYDRVILFVGRPASDRWLKNSVAYQKLLTKDMEINGFRGDVRVMICSEAQAALAYEYSNKNIKPGEVVLIVDCGSSTFDAVLVKDREIIGEYSRQLGAGQIENLMYAKILSQGDNAVMQNVEKREHMVNEKSAKLITYRKGYHILKLREKKEQYFGSEGDNGDVDNLRYASIALPTGKLKQDIDTEFMDEILNKTPILVEFSYTGMGGDSKDTLYPSFVAATRDFLEQTKKKVCDTKHMKVDRVILTGGASVMPFVSEQVCQVFGKNVFGTEDGIEKKRTREPAFSVGKGLTFMGYVEYLKRMVLEKCMELIREELDTRESTIRRCLTDAYVDVGWNQLIEDLRLWKNTSALGTTFREGVIGQGFDPPIEEIRQKIQLHLNDDKDVFGWTLKERIGQIVDTTFKDLFGCSASYTLTVNLEVVEAVVDHRGDAEHPLHDITYTPSMLLGSYASNKSFGVPLSTGERQDYFNVVLGRETQVRSELNTQLWDKMEMISPRLRENLVSGLRDSLIDYLETITPFFVEKVQSAPVHVGGFL